ncbi:MAG: hypothetical protein KJ566_01050 [Nanoarchaeota archaeon]|nr:hypothetical protein [Nanoarchaeota archaeon]
MAGGTNKGNGKSLDKKIIKKSIEDCFHEANESEGNTTIKDCIEILIGYAPKSKQALNFAYKIVGNQIKKYINLKSAREKYLQQAEELYNSLRGK